MEKKLKNRLDELKNELEQAVKIHNEITAKKNEIEIVILKTQGAIQVLEEELKDPEINE